MKLLPLQSDWLFVIGDTCKEKHQQSQYIIRVNNRCYILYPFIFFLNLYSTTEFIFRWSSLLPTTELKSAFNVKNIPHLRSLPLSLCGIIHSAYVFIIVYTKYFVVLSKTIPNSNHTIYEQIRQDLHVSVFLFGQSMKSNF